MTCIVTNTHTHTQTDTRTHTNRHTHTQTDTHTMCVPRELELTMVTKVALAPNRALFFPGMKGVAPAINTPGQTALKWLGLVGVGLGWVGLSWVGLGGGVYL